MSDPTPPDSPNSSLPAGSEPTAPIEHTAPKGRGKRRTAIIVIVAVLVATVLGSGAFAAYKVFFAGGPQPAEALPASTVAILSIDLNPSAGQKIEAIKTIRKFPALRKNLGLDTEDDLRRYIFEKGLGGTDCEDLDYDKAMKPWIGKRAAFAAVDLGDKFPAPAVVLQISDQNEAKDAFEEIVECADFGSDFGFAVGEDYLVASDSAAHAEQILQDGQKRSLSEDAMYQRWTEEAGDQGVLNFYVAKKASEYLAEALEELGESFAGGFGAKVAEESSSREGDLVSEELEGDPGLSRSTAPRAEDCEGDPFGAAKDQLENFEGLAGTVRFADGGMELSLASSGIEQLESDATVGDKVSRLPGNTTLVAALGVPEGYAEQMVSAFSCGFGPGSGGDRDFLAEAERETGLALPEDLVTLLGSAITISVGGDAPDSGDDLSPENTHLGVVLHGNADEVKDLIPKIEGALGFPLEEIPIRVVNTDSKVVLSPSEEYANALLADGALGDSASFKDAVPNADRATGILYVDFDSEWRQTLVELIEEMGGSADDARSAEENLEPLKSFGLSSWTEGGTSHLLLKLATD